jgi:saccharopine dehydrogenase (NAD+, L-lysine forming)
MLGAMMVVTGQWKGKGVFNVEEFNPDPFMEKIGVYGLPWNETVNADLEL